MASSRLIVDSPPLVDPHSLLNKVTFSFLLKIGSGGTGSFEEEESRNKHEITVNFKFKFTLKATRRRMFVVKLGCQ